MPTGILICQNDVSKIVTVWFFESAEKLLEKVCVLKNVTRITIKHSCLTPDCFDKNYQFFKTSKDNYVYYLIGTEDEETVEIRRCPICLYYSVNFQDFYLFLSPVLKIIGIEGIDAANVLKIVAEILKARP